MMEPFSSAEVSCCATAVARTRPQRPGKQTQRPNHLQKPPRKQIHRRGAPSRCQYISPPPAASLPVCHPPSPSPPTGSATARHVPSHLRLPRRGYPAARRVLRRYLRGGGCGGGGARARADGAVPAAVLPSAARRARRDLRQHPRCVPFLGPVLGSHAILAGCVCANLLARSRWAWACWTCSPGVSWK